MRICITGASLGIGAETAREMAEGNEIFVHYHSSVDAAEQVAADVADRGGTAHVVQADLRSESGCRELARQVTEHTDTLDVLVNNAGGLVKRALADEYEWALMEEIFALNLFSAMMITRLSLPMLKRSPAPSIIFLTSVAARSGAPTATMYGASKGAIDSLTRGLAGELAPTIRVNAVAPGVIDTPFHDKLTSPDRMKSFADKAALKRIGEAAHIARTIRFLIENDYITGETIDVNGGLNMR